jgi:hypothetical protein
VQAPEVLPGKEQVMTKLLGVAATLFAALTFVGAAGAHQSAASTPSRTSFTIVLDGRYGNPCGEVVDLIGTARASFMRFTDAGGNTHFVLALNYQGASGVGEETGLKYRAVDAFHEASLNFEFGQPPQAPSEFTDESMLRFVSQGATTDLVIRAKFHIAISATGEIASFFSEESTVCT